MKSTRLDFLKDELQALKDQHLYQQLMPFGGKPGPEITINGKPVLNFSSNNYLGLATHPKLIAAAKKAIDDYGVGAGAVRTIIGTMNIHNELEEKIAKFKHVEATMVYTSGFTANIGAIPTILTDKDVIISDALNHASIIDACRLAPKGIAREVYAHNDMNALEDILKRSGNYKHRMIITDGVFSMDGDIAKLPEIVNLAQAYDAIVMVDDAHGSGVLGEGGRGTTHHFGLSDQVDIQVGTLSKAIGCVGGYVASTQAMRDFMINRARPILFSTAMPPSVVMSCMAAIELLENDPTLNETLWNNTRYFKDGMAKIGLPIASETPICPVIVGESEKAQLLSKRLLDEGVYARAIVFPTVARDRARVRVMINANHTRDHLDRAIAAFKRVGAELGIC